MFLLVTASYQLAQIKIIRNNRKQQKDKKKKDQNNNVC